MNWRLWRVRRPCGGHAGRDCGADGSGGSLWGWLRRRLGRPTVGWLLGRGHRAHARPRTRKVRPSHFSWYNKKHGGVEARPSPTAASRRNEPARLGGLRRRVGRRRESRVGLSPMAAAQLKISEFCQRCCVCGRSLIGISALSTNLFGGEVNKSIAYWCPRARDLHVCGPIAHAPSYADRETEATHPCYACVVACCKASRRTATHNTNTTKSDPMTIALVH